MCGELPVLHGHEKGKGISSPVNQARGAFLRLLHTVLEGHGHRTSGHAESDMWHRETFLLEHGLPVRPDAGIRTRQPLELGFRDRDR
jgi:hypothetical protein